MYQLTASNSVSPIAWNHALQALQNCPFHTYEWSQYSAENRGRSVVYFTLTDANSKIAAMAYGQISSRLSRKRTIFRSLVFGSFPAYRDSESLNGIIRQIQAYASGNGFMSIDWTSFGTPDACSSCNILQENGKKRWEFTVDLEGTEDDLRKRLHGKKRNLIKKAEKAGIRIERPQSMEHILRYRDLAMKTWKRKTEQGISFPMPPGENQFALMKRHLIDPGIGRMYLAYDDDCPVAGAFFAGFSDIAYYSLSAAGETGLKKAAPDLLIWTAMCDYQREGARIFNLGGVSEDEVPDNGLEKSGLYHFKVRFAAQVKPCFNSNSILKPQQYRFWQLFSAVKPKLRSILPWKR